MSPLRGNSSSAGTSCDSSAATMALRSGTGARCARMSSAVLPVAATAARAASSSITLRPDADHHVHRPARLRRAFRCRMPPSLPPRRDQIVRPLEAHAAHAEPGQGIHGARGPPPGSARKDRPACRGIARPATGRSRRREARSTRGRGGRGRRSGVRPAPPRPCPARGGSDSSSRVLVDSSVHSTSSASMRARTSAASSASMRSGASALTPGASR